MRTLFFLPALLIASTFVFAQQNPPPTKDPNAQLDKVLIGWEKAITGLQTFQAECQRTTLDRVFQTKEIFKGTAKYLKSSGPGEEGRASLELYKQTSQGDSKTLYEKYIVKGTTLYHFAPDIKVVWVHDMTLLKSAQKFDNSFFTFLFGGNFWDAMMHKFSLITSDFPLFLFEINALNAKKSYQVSLTSSDQNYHYLKVQPKSELDKVVFTVARVVLRRDNFLPAQVWFHRPNGNDVTWDFQLRPNIAIPASAFEQPKLPEGWHFDGLKTQAEPIGQGNSPR